MGEQFVRVQIDIPVEECDILDRNSIKNAAMDKAFMYEFLYWLVDEFGEPIPAEA